MGRVFLHFLILLGVAACVGSSVETRAAQDPAHCFLATDEVMSVAEAAGSAGWRCDTGKLNARGDHSWSRISAEAIPTGDPVLIGDAMASDGFVIGRAQSDGNMISRVVDSATVARNWTTGTRFALPLEGLDGNGPLFVRIDRPLGPDVADSLEVVSAHAAARDRDRSLVLLGLVVGMLALTAAVSGFMALSLRRWFAVFHFVFSLLLIVYVTTAGSLVFLIAPDLSLWARSIISYAAFAWAMAMLAPFALAFFEHDVITPTMRRVAIGCGVITFSASFLLPLGAVFGVSLRTAYNLFFIPGAIATLVITALAWRQGSRAARLFVLAWSVPFLFALERLFRNLGFYSLPPIADFGLYLALAFKAAILMAAIGFRVNALRQERDAALAASSDLAREVRLDPLTGLGNRRDYGAYTWKQGDMLALIDIDCFKSVNDTYGHTTGDRVLEWLGKMLRREVVSGPFAGAWRLGGEEFAVAVQADRIEIAALELDRIRREIPYLIDEHVPGLDQSITVSIGLARIDPASPGNGYREADLLLYNAKRSGRDQLCYDRREPARETSQKPRSGPRQLKRSRKVS